MSIPPGEIQRCPTYVKKSIKLRPRIKKYDKSEILLILGTLNKTKQDVLNVYAPRAVEARKFLTNHKITKNTIMAGEFNCQHAMWNSEKATDYKNSIRNSKRNPTFLTSGTDNKNLALQNTPGKFTQFPHTCHRFGLVACFVQWAE